MSKAEFLEEASSLVGSSLNPGNSLEEYFKCADFSAIPECPVAVQYPSCFHFLPTIFQKS
jgi:hypothetical protein